MLGHGEVAFKSLVEALRRGEDPRRLPGHSLSACRDRASPVLNTGAPIPHPDAAARFPLPPGGRGTIRAPYLHGEADPAPPFQLRLPLLLRLLRRHPHDSRPLAGPVGGANRAGNSGSRPGLGRRLGGVLRQQLLRPRGPNRRVRVPDQGAGHSVVGRGAGGHPAGLL